MADFVQTIVKQTEDENIVSIELYYNNGLESFCRMWIANKDGYNQEAELQKANEAFTVWYNGIVLKARE